MLQIKICGITSVEDGLVAARVGADAIGLNFYARSPRHVSVDTACQIIQTLPTGVAKVGLFVNASAADVCHRFDELKLDLIQLHGDEPPEFLTQLGGRPIMRALRVGSDGLRPIIAYLDRCRELHALPTMVLLDSLVAGEYGGTGQVADWSAAKEYMVEPAVPPLVLAGGLTAENVASAIQAVGPAAVDVASGVESEPGRKDPAAVAAFVAAARAAFCT